jgi:hypothetical protein
MLSVTPAPIVGDVNADGIVNGLDISIFATNWMKTGGQGLTGDANHDGIVNGLDINLIATNWLRTDLSPPKAIAGEPFTNVPVFHFTDTDQESTVGDYSAVITLGNSQAITLTGTPSAKGQIVAAKSGGFDVQLSYTYAVDVTNQTFGVVVSDNTGHTVSSNDPAFSVGDALLTAGSLTPPTAVAGAPFPDLPVFSFTDANPYSTASDYTAVVTLGDRHVVTLTGNASPNGQIVPKGAGSFDVQLSYSYATELSNQTFGVSVFDPSGQTVGLSTAAFSVARTSLTAVSLSPPNVVVGEPFTDTPVFHFTDTDPASTVSDFSAVVTLGNGNTVTLTSVPSPNGQIVADKSSGFDVQLSYAYTTDINNQTFGVSVSDISGHTVSLSANFSSLNDALLTAGNLTPPAAVAGQPFSNVPVFSFTDANTSSVAGDFTAFVVLGDGHTITLTGTPSANGQIVAGTHGSFDVQLSYSYAVEMSGATFGVSVSDNGGRSTGASISTFAVISPITAANPEIQLDATNASSVGTTQGGALFVATSQQYLSETDNFTLNSAINNASQLTISFQAEQTTLGLDRNFVSRWDYGSSGSIAIDTGTHSGDTSEISVWVSDASGNIAGIVETQGAGLVASKDYSITVVFDGNQIDPMNRLSIYVDGIKQTLTNEGGAVPTTLATSNAPLDVGSWPGLGRYLDGAVHNLNIWTVAETQAQVQASTGLTYANMTASQRIGLVQSFSMTEEQGARSDAVNGAVLNDPTGVRREQIVTSWASTGTLGAVFTPSPEGQAPDFISSVPSMNGQAALSFNGLDDALKYASRLLPNDGSGDIYVVARFTGGGDNLAVDTLFSSASDTTAVDYFFLASYDVSNIPADLGANTPLLRVRFRDDEFQTDARGTGLELQTNVTYVLHLWGNGVGQGYGMSINGLNLGSFYTASNPQDFAAAAGGWFSDVPNRTNMTIGDFERSDGPQGFAASLISEIDVFGGTPSQPVLPRNQSAAIVDYLMAKYDANRLGVFE